MAYDFLMNTAAALFFICYIPELYANWKNKNANFYNMPEKVLLLLASSFALAYAILNSDLSLISNYGPILALDIIAFLMRLYYVYETKNKLILPPSSDSSPDESPSPSPDLESQVSLEGPT
uniref:PQ-loop repeat-containing protein n=1 Tax=viral metagenome TaxID=1070528 RepID=A0A6C0APD3_9ZZZZ